MAARTWGFQQPGRAGLWPWLCPTVTALFPLWASQLPPATTSHRPSSCLPFSPKEQGLQIVNGIRIGPEPWPSEAPADNGVLTDKLRRAEMSKSSFDSPLRFVVPPTLLGSHNKDLAQTQRPARLCLLDSGTEGVRHHTTRSFSFVFRECLAS